MTQVLATSSQIQLFPPPYMIKRFADVDMVILLEEAQYKKKQFFDHFVIRDSKGKTHNLKLQLAGGGGRDRLCDIVLAYWHEDRARILKCLEEVYAGAPYFDRTMKWLRQELPWEPDMTLAGLTHHLMAATMRLLGLEKPIHRSRLLMAERCPDPSEWIASLCECAGANAYMQGKAAMDSYFDAKPFLQKGMALFSQSWEPPTFVPGWPTGEISILHALFHVGPVRVMGLLNYRRGMEPWSPEGTEQ